jgi:hypothetical protein
MTESRFDTLLRGTDSFQGRRHTLKAPGAAALGTMAGPPLAAEAGKNGNVKRWVSVMPRASSPVS